MTGNFLISSGAKNNLPGNERPYFGWEAFFPEIIVGVSTVDRGSRQGKLKRFPRAFETSIVDSTDWLLAFFRA